MLVGHLRSCSHVKETVIVEGKYDARALYEAKKDKKRDKKCGKCDEMFSNYHAARAHSGLARPEGESQVLPLSVILH